MTAETWVWVLGVLLTLLGFWLRDWKDRIETALAVKQEKLDSQEREITELKVAMAKRIERDEFESFRREIKRDIDDGINRVINTIKGHTA